MSAEIVPDPQEARERLQAAQKALINAAKQDNVRPELGAELMEAALQSRAADIHETRIRNAKREGPTIADKIRDLLNK